MLTFAKEYSNNRHSQFGEDGILKELLRRIDPPLHVAVEFGGHDSTFCSNTASLRYKNWKVWMYDLSCVPPHVEQKMITPENVNELPPCSVLSIDIDGNDYNVWKAYTGKPDIVIIEINSSVLPTEDKPVSDAQHGTAYKPMVELGHSKGYFLICHTGNLVWVRGDHRHVFPEIPDDPIGAWQLFFNISHL